MELINELPNEIQFNVIKFMSHPVSDLFKTFLRKCEARKFEMKVNEYKFYLEASYSKKAGIYYSLSDDEDETVTETETSIKDQYRYKVNKKIKYYENKVNEINNKHIFDTVKQYL